jgi:hypothetical protein
MMNYSAGTWTHSGKPKGEQVGGPVAAHVYETPVTYILSLRTQDPTGNVFDLKTKIVVVDTDNYWTSGGRANVLLANASTSVWPTWANNTRYLLEAGNDYTRLGDININNRQNVCIQAYGTDGKINTCSIVTGGSGYINGTYTNVPLWRGTGDYATANITVSGGSVTSLTISNGGSGYSVGDSLAVFDGAGDLGPGVGFYVDVSTVNVNGNVTSFGTLSGGTGFTNQTKNNYSLAGGTGTGLTANIVVSGTSVTSVIIATPGTGYSVNDRLTLDNNSGELGGSGSIVRFYANVTSITNETDNKPIVHNIYADRIQSSTPTTTARIVFNKLDANSKTNILDWGLTIDTGDMCCKVSAIDVLFHKCNAISSINGEFTQSSWAVNKNQTFNKVRRLFLHQCIIDGRRSTPGRELRATAGGGGAGGVFFNRGYEFVILGSTVKSAPQQSVRLYVDRSFLAHNYFYDSLGNTADGPIGTLGTITGGSGYASGTYLNVPLTGGRGTGANGNVTISGGSVTAVVVANTGIDYFPNDSLSALNAKLGGSGSGFSVNVSTIISSVTSREALTIRAANANPIYANSQLLPYLDGSYPSISSEATTIATTRNVVIADNKLGSSTDSSNTNWCGSSKPSNFEEICAIELLIFERNTYPDIINKISAYTATQDTRNVISRNETFQSSDTNRIGFRASNSSTSDTYTLAPGWARGPWYSDNWLGTDVDSNTIDYQHKVTPGYISAPRPIANVETYLTVRGWGQEVTAGGSIIGPAPLVIVFDAVDTRSANANCNTFREFGYHFDFGYTSANAAIIGNWQYSGRPKANQIGGPLAAHMYEVPGTYNASVRAQNPQGEYQDKYVTIVVQDANTIYAGSKTVLVSNTGATDAAYPSAATYNIADSGAVNFQSDTRYLFKAGENYSAYSQSLTSNVFRFQISSFGTGSKPLVNFGADNGLGFTPTDKKLTAAVIQNCNVRNMRVTYANDFHFINCERYGTSMFSGGADPNIIATNQPDPNNQWPVNIGIWNSSYNCFDIAYGWFGGGKYITFIGNEPYNVGVHTFRSQPTYRGMISHNRLYPPGQAIWHQIKLYGGSKGSFPKQYPSSAYLTPLRGILPFNVDASAILDFPQYGFINQYVVIADNVVAPANNNYQIAAQPQNVEQDERITDVIVERIVFENNPGATNAAQKAVVMKGQNIVARDLTIGTRLATNHFITLSPTELLTSEFIPISARGPYYIPSPHPDIGAANNTFASVTGILPNKAGT